MHVENMGCLRSIFDILSTKNSTKIRKKSLLNMSIKTWIRRLMKKLELKNLVELSRQQTRYSEVIRGKKEYYKCHKVQIGRERKWRA
jgi:hypothetical protein